MENEGEKKVEKKEEVKSVTPPPAQRKVKKIEFQLIKTDGDVALIQYVDVIERGDKEIKFAKKILVPVKELELVHGEKFGKVDSLVIDAAIPYGIPWEEFEPSEFDAELFAIEMYNHQIYTEVDFVTNSSIAETLLRKGMGANRKGLFDFVKKNSGGKK